MSATRIFPRSLEGRNANGSQRDRGALYHAVTENGYPAFGKALCGASPGSRSGGWAKALGTEVTCPRCLKKLPAVAEPVEPDVTDQTPNQQRASYAAELLESSRHYDADDQVSVQDLLSDLMHFCDGKGWDFTEILRVATDNFNAEVMDGEFAGRAT